MLLTMSMHEGDNLKRQNCFVVKVKEVTDFTIRKKNVFSGFAYSERQGLVVTDANRWSKPTKYLTLSLEEAFVHRCCNPEGNHFFPPFDKHCISSMARRIQCTFQGLKMTWSLQELIEAS